MSLWSTITARNGSTEADRLTRAQVIIDHDAGIQWAILNLRTVLEARGAISQFIAAPEQTAAFARLTEALNAAGADVPDGWRVSPWTGQLIEQSKFSWTATALVLGAPFAIAGVVNAIAGAGAATAAPAAGSVLPSSQIPLVSQVGHLATPVSITSQGASAAVYGAAFAPAVASVGPATVSSIGGTTSGAVKALSSLPGLISKIFAPSTSTSPIVTAGAYGPGIVPGTSFDSSHWLMAGLAVLAVVAIARNA